MNSTHQVIWRRTVDPDAASDRRQKLLRWYAAPVAALLLIALALGGIGAFAGVLILFGSIGLLLLVWVELTSRNRAANAEILLADGALVLNNRRVELSRLETWTTTMSAASVHVSGVTTHAILAKALFRLALFDAGQRGVRPDGGPAFEVVEFVWASMPESDLVEVRDAIAPYLSAPWVPVDRLRD